MKKTLKPFVLLLTAVLALAPALTMTGCSGSGTNGSIQGIAIDGEDFGITIEGTNVSENSVYTSNDIIYYEDLDAYESGFPYGEGVEHERHPAEEAAAHTVINITEPGAYTLSGSMEKGQIRVDLGEDAEINPEAAVTLILDGLDLTCDVAPAILFLNVYECDNAWTTETAQSKIDTAAAGANLVIADGSVNNISGGHVARIYADGEGEEKLWKQDGAIYSYMSMNVAGGETGDGILNLHADNEGLDTELHLTINGGNINIYADNDGINTNEDGVSVTTINGGNIHIMAGLGEEGDGIDSNGWLVINGGTVIASANPAADAGLDSNMGSYINGGTVVALGSTMDWAESESEQITMNLQFASFKDSGDAIAVKNQADDSVVFAYDPSEDEVLADNARKYQGAILSSPDFTLESTYNVYIGGSVTGTETAGVYDPASVSAYEGGTRQSFTGTDVYMRPGSGFGGGMGGNFGGGFGGGRGQGQFNGQMPADGEVPELPEGMTPPEGMEPGQRPERPEDQQGGQRPEGMTPPDGMELPEGFDPSQMQPGQMPEGMTPPDGMEPPEAGTITETGEARTYFYMQDKVNAFSGVADAK